MKHEVDESCSRRNLFDHIRIWLGEGGAALGSPNLESERTKIALDSAQSKVLASKSLWTRRRQRTDCASSIAIAARSPGITGVLQLVPVKKGKTGDRTNVARLADPKKLKLKIKIAETQRGHYDWAEGQI